MASNGTPAWELSKENAAPLARGRNVKTFESSLLKQKKSAEEDGDNQRMMQHFEQLLASQTNKETDDPLVPWLRYIKFHQDAFPSDTNAQFLLMERCARALMSWDKYKNDIRFIRVCVVYADRTTFPGDVYKYLHRHNIGTKVALFWFAWAWVAETKGDYAFAEKVFIKALEKEAQPFAMLQQRHKQFQRRASKYWLKQQEEQDDEEDGGESATGGRAALGGLSEKRVQRNDRRSRPTSSSGRPPVQTSSSSSSRTFVDRNASRQSRPADENNGATAPAAGGFAIFSDENTNPDDDGYDLQDSSAGPPPQQELETEADRKKENTRHAERWNERGGYSSCYTAAASSGAAPGVRAPAAPSFAVHVDEDCQAKRKEELQKTNEQFKAFREREGVDRSEKLAQDPMRYIANPEKLQQDNKKNMKKADDVANTTTEKASEPSTASKTKASSSITCGFSKKLVAKDAQGQECCFEEYRGTNQFYKLTAASTNFNFFARDILEDDEADSIEDVEMEEDDDQQTVQSSSSQAGRRVLFSMNVSVDHKNHTSFVLNASTASSATGGGGISFSASREEETINTKFAMKELSMMFSSPGGALGGGSETKLPLLTQTNVMEDDDDDAAHGVNNSIIYHVGSSSGGFNVYQEEEEDSEEKGTSEGGGFQIFQDNEAAANMAAEELSIMQEASKKRGFEIFGDAPTSQEKPEKKGIPIFCDEPKEDKSGFQIFSEEAAVEEAKGLQFFDEEEPQKGPGFQISSEEKKEESMKSGFQIFSEGAEAEERKEVLQIFEDEPATSTRTPFAIRRDSEKSAAADETEDADGGGDTATLSLFGEAMDAMNDLIQSKEEPKSMDKSGSDRLPFSIRADDDEYDSASDEPAAGEGDTATLSIFGDAMEALQDLSLTHDQESRPRRPSSLSLPDVDTSMDDFRKYRSRDSGAILTDGAAFGDISLIETDATRSHLSPTMTGTETFSNAFSKVDYKALHKANVCSAIRSLDKQARHASNGVPFAGPETDLALMLSKEGNIVASRTQNMPVGLKRKASAKGAEIKVGSRTGVVKHELGRGSYGVVVLLDAAQQGVIAVKAQCPTDCLAWEYVLMKRLQERTKNHAPFPKPLSFVSLSDGALLSMSVGSQNGMNLVDINNVYQVNEGGPVPELIALHYTARMLKHIETLHWHGKMLHCDVKPDNWVMMASNSAYSGCTELVEASDLMLVDFGRAIDLTAAAKEGVDPMDVKLSGHAAAEDMACAAMRMNLGWSFDIDTFGICASAHVLLYGSHIEMDIVRPSKRWKLRKRLRRYWQNELWTEIFDTLLNLDDISQTAIGSRPRSLRLLRGKFEAHLGTRAKELESLLKHQARILPNRRLS